MLHFHCFTVRDWDNAVATTVQFSMTTTNVTIDYKLNSYM